MANAFLGFPYILGDDYRETLCKAVQAAGFSPVIADNIYTGEHVWDNVTSLIDDFETEVAIFDITGLNSNVLIELGYSMGVSHPTIILINPIRHLELLGLQSRQSIPLPIPEDIAGKQRIQYDNNDQLRKEVAKNLNIFVRQFGNDFQKFRSFAMQYLQDGEKATQSIIANLNAKLGLNLSYATGRNWLQQLVQEGTLERRGGKPVYYSIVKSKT